MARTSKKPETGTRLNDAQRLAWLRLIRSENVGPATFRAFVNQFGGAQAAIEALPARGGARRTSACAASSDAEAELEAARKVGAHLVALGERGLSPRARPGGCAPAS